MGASPFPYRFYGNPAYQANNRLDCIRLLRGFHTGELGAWASRLTATGIRGAIRSPRITVDGRARMARPACSRRNADPTGRMVLRSVRAHSPVAAMSCPVPPVTANRGGQWFIGCHGPEVDRLDAVDGAALPELEGDGAGDDETLRWVNDAMGPAGADGITRGMETRGRRRRGPRRGRSRCRREAGSRLRCCRRDEPPHRALRSERPR